MEILWIFLGIFGMLIIWNIIRFLLFKKDFVPVLMYHRIVDSVTPSSLRYVKHKGKILDLDEMKTTLNQFDRQLEYLAKRGYTAVLMNDYLNIKAKKPVALTLMTATWTTIPMPFRCLRNTTSALRFIYAPTKSLICPAQSI